MSALVGYAESSSDSNASGSPPVSPPYTAAVISSQSSYQIPSLKRKRTNGAREAKTRTYDGNDNGTNVTIANHRLLRRINGNASVNAKGSDYGFSTLTGKNSLGLETASNFHNINDFGSRKLDDTEDAAARKTAAYENSLTDENKDLDNTTIILKTENERREKRRVAELQRRQRQKLLVQQQKEQQYESKKPFLPSKTSNPSSDTSTAIPNLPTLPSKFLDLYSAPPRASTVDDPNLHSGRRRQNPHIDGQWPAHVYLEWHPNQQTRSLLSRLLEIHQKLSSPSAYSIPNYTQTTLHTDASTSQFTLHPLHHTPPPSTPLPLHISLSAPLVLPSIQAATAFKENLSTALKELRTGEVRVQLANYKARKKDGRSRLREEPLRWVRNADGSRWFLVVGVDDILTVGSDEIKEQNIDTVFSKRKSSGMPTSVDKKYGSSDGRGVGAMTGRCGYSYSRSYQNGSGYTTKTRKVLSSNTAIMMNSSSNKANSLLGKVTNHHLPPLQALFVVTDAIALRFGLRRFVDGYGKDGNEAVQISAQGQCDDGLKRRGKGESGLDLGIELGNPHISLAWTLSKPEKEPIPINIDNVDNYSDDGDGKDVDASLRREYASLLDKLTRLVLVFRQVKIKIGRDVCCVQLQGRRKAGDFGVRKSSDARGSDDGRSDKGEDGTSLNRIGDRGKGQATMENAEEEKEEEAESDLLEVEEAEEAEEFQEDFRKERNILGYN